MSAIYIKLAARKVGMTQIVSNGFFYPSTVLWIPEHVLLNVRAKEKDGYNALVLGTNLDIKKHKNINKPQRVQMEKQALGLFDKTFEVRMPDAQDMSMFASKIGHKFTVGDFILGQDINIRTEDTIGKGFAGVMKRHNFRGLEASHGVSVSHRSHGSTGQRQDPGKVFKNKKMAGHMGAVATTIKNLFVNDIYAEQSLISVEGAVPGAESGIVTISSPVTYKNIKNIIIFNGVNFTEENGN